MPSPTSTIEVDEIVRSGNLYKEGVSRLKWNTRYFELLKHRIVYYDHEGSDTVRGEATLEGATIQSTKAARPGKFAFRLNLPAADTQHKKFILSADSLDETKAWIAALKGCGVESSFEDESTARRSSIAESFRRGVRNLSPKIHRTTKAHVSRHLRQHNDARHATF